MRHETKNLRQKTKMMVTAALFAAMVFLTTAYLFHIPLGAAGGYVHLGDAFIYLAACMLPAPYAIAAAAIGAGMADCMMGAAIWAPATVIIKAFNVLPFTSRPTRLLCRRNVLGVVLSGVVTMIGYAVAEGILTGNWIVPFATLFTSGLIQPIASGILFMIMAAAIDQAGLKARVGLLTAQ